MKNKRKRSNGGREKKHKAKEEEKEKKKQCTEKRQSNSSSTTSARNLQLGSISIFFLTFFSSSSVSGSASVRRAEERILLHVRIVSRVDSRRRAALCDLLLRRNVLLGTRYGISS